MVRWSYPEDVPERFDFVVASIHNRFKLDRNAQTQGLLWAISDPHTTIIGHMTGRQLQRRPGFESDVEKVLRACAKHDVVVEIQSGCTLHSRTRPHALARPYGPQRRSSCRRGPELR